MVVNGVVVNGVVVNGVVVVVAFVSGKSCVVDVRFTVVEELVKVLAFAEEVEAD